MVTLPEGFWTATNPAASPITDEISFEQHNMNRTLMQKGNAAHLAAVLSKHGVTGYNDVLGIFMRMSSTNMLERMPTIIAGLDANKPTSDPTNNHSWYFATDTMILYTVQNGVRIQALSQATVTSGGMPSRIDPDDPAEEGTSTSLARRDHQHQIITGTPSSITNFNSEGNADEFVRRDHRHHHGSNVHERGRALALNADKLGIDYNPASYTPDPSIAEADDADDLSAHLKGISDALNTISSAGVTSGGTPSRIDPDDPSEEGTSSVVARSNHQHQIVTGTPITIGTGNNEGSEDEFVRRDHRHAHGNNVHERNGLLQIDGDKLDIDFNPTNYTPDISIVEADHVDELSAHLKGIDDEIATIVGSITTNINSLIANAPGALNTLNELAAALNDDPNYSTTLMNLLNDKVDDSDIVNFKEIFTTTETDRPTGAGEGDIWGTREV